MTNTPEFSHDTLAHLLKDHRLAVPDFQREYSWEAEHVEDYWRDITRSIKNDKNYFLGTVVLVAAQDGRNEMYIVDGQQRIVTTALTLFAISLAMQEMGEDQAKDKIFSDYIADYDLEAKKVQPKLRLSSTDHSTYYALINSEDDVENYRQRITGKPSENIIKSFEVLRDKIKNYAHGPDQYDRVVELKKFLAERAQVLLAVAPGLPEAYVIFETLNERGRDLTAADLLKNFFLSNVGNRADDALKKWTEVVSKFEKPDDLITFIKIDYTSRWGHVKKKELYQALQDKLLGDHDGDHDEVYGYLERLAVSLKSYEALRNSDDQYWSPLPVDVRDEIIAHRRFRIEAPFAMYLAAMRNWRPKNYLKLIKDSTSWSIRATLAGVMGTGSAEKHYGEVARLINEKKLNTVDDVKDWFLSKTFVPNDHTFGLAIRAVNDSNTTKVKYLLARIEFEMWKEKALDVESFPAWESKSVTVEHIIPRSRNIVVDSDNSNSELKELHVSLANLTLLERTRNNSAADSDFSEKVAAYRDSNFVMTKALGELTEFSDKEISERMNEIVRYALKAWPL